MARKSPFTLPLSVVGPVDVARLRRELEGLDDYLHQAGLRAHGQASAKLPRTSRLLEELAASNELNLLQADDRTQAAAFLKGVQLSAPVITLSFASDPSAVFIAKITTWLRQNIHPQLLLRTGLQPTIAAGCIVRTANRQFDFSLRGRFSQHRELLIERLRAGSESASER